MPRPLEDIFETLTQLPADARAAYLDDVCRDDAAMRERLESWLASEERRDRFMAEPEFSSSSGIDDDLVGQAVGPYKVLQQLGVGGYGAVYLAEQREPITRRVALKVIKLGMDTRQVIARFEAERQALAMMDHPNIAKVHDAGATESGRPYFVMELVRGMSITTYCDQCKLSANERLPLFMDVCRAVHHAHQKGVIHRDIKPSNILVTLHDGVPVPKVIDFGIAKATNVNLTDKTLFTNFQQFVGTPAYTSPEQVEMSGLDVDTRSDIYSLGVLLYELLTGTTPLESETLKQAAYLEIQQTIVESEPPTPSSRLSTLANARQLEVAAARSDSPDRLRQALRGELDWIVMKALEKNRERRYDFFAFSPDSRFIAIPSQTDSGGFTVGIWDLATFEETRALEHPSWVAGVAWLPDSQTLVTMTMDPDRSTRLWDVDESAVKQIRRGGMPIASAVTPDGRYLAWDTQYSTAGIHLWKLPTLEPTDLRRRAEGSGNSHAIVFSLNGQRLAVADPDYGVVLWDTATWQPVRDFIGHRWMVTDLSFSSDGKRLASAGRDSQCLLWDVESGREVARFQGNTADLAPDGSALAAGGAFRFRGQTAPAKSSIRIYRAPSLEEIGRQRSAK